MKTTPSFALTSFPGRPICASAWPKPFVSATGIRSQALAIIADDADLAMMAALGMDDKSSRQVAASLASEQVRAAGTCRPDRGPACGAMAIEGGPRNCFSKSGRWWPTRCAKAIRSTPTATSCPRTWCELKAWRQDGWPGAAIIVDTIKVSAFDFLAWYAPLAFSLASVAGRRTHFGRPRRATPLDRQAARHIDAAPRSEHAIEGARTGRDRPRPAAPFRAAPKRRVERGGRHLELCRQQPWTWRRRNAEVHPTLTLAPTSPGPAFAPWGTSPMPPGCPLASGPGAFRTPARGVRLPIRGQALRDHIRRRPRRRQRPGQRRNHRNRSSAPMHAHAARALELFSLRGNAGVPGLVGKISQAIRRFARARRGVCRRGR